MKYNSDHSLYKAIMDLVVKIVFEHILSSYFLV